MLSKDWLKRVQGLTADTPEQPTNKSNDDMIFIGDPLVVHFDDKTTVGKIHKIVLGKQSKNYLNVDDFYLKNLSFNVKFLNLVKAEDDRLF